MTDDNIQDIENLKDVPIYKCQEQNAKICL